LAEENDAIATCKSTEDKIKKMHHDFAEYQKQKHEEHNRVVADT
jgi:hypothetical protein